MHIKNQYDEWYKVLTFLSIAQIRNINDQRKFSRDCMQRDDAFENIFDVSIKRKSFLPMKNFSVLLLAMVLIGVMLFAGVNGVMRGHATGPFFIFLAVCTATGLSIDLHRFVKEKIRQSNSRKFGR